MTAAKVTVFLAGIIQGSRADRSLHPQDYRRFLRELLTSALGPDCLVFDPVEEYPASGDYDDARASATLRALIERAAASEVVLAYLPEASMGTAIEMWEARRAGRLVLAVSPLEANWVVRSLADRVFRDLPHFEAFVRSGELERLVRGCARGVRGGCPPSRDSPDDHSKNSRR